MLTRASASLTVAALATATLLTSASSAAAAEVDRYGCDSPIHTGRNLPSFEESAYGVTKKVVLASAEDFADGLAATTIAAATRSPLYVAYEDRMHDVILDEIKEHGITQVTIVGGTAAVPADLEQQIKARGAWVRRIAGATRFDTARAVVDETRRLTGKTTTPVFLATGLNYPDAMAAGAAAAKAGGVVMLTEGKRLGTAAQRVLKSASSVSAIGGDAASAVRAAGVRATTYVGADRFETATKVARGVFTGADRAVLSNGTAIGHSMVASTFAANIGAPLVFTTPKELPSATRGYLADTGARVTAIGGTSNISDGVLSTVKSIGRTNSPVPTPTPMPTPSPSPGAGTDIAAWEQDILARTNAERAKAGVAPLEWQPCLATAARSWSQTMAKPGVPFEHSGKDRGAACNLPYTGENIAMGYSGPADVMTGWMTSSGHRSNILLSEYRYIGVGVAVTSDGTPYYTQVFSY